jgi:hypothetical protein
MPEPSITPYGDLIRIYATMNLEINGPANGRDVLYFFRLLILVSTDRYTKTYHALYFVSYVLHQHVPVRSNDWAAYGAMLSCTHSAVSQMAAD